jgi:hypothetical protein
MIEIIMKIQGRDTITHIILTYTQLINRYFHIVFTVNKYSQLNCICILLKSLFILHLVTIQLAKIQQYS